MESPAIALETARLELEYEQSKQAAKIIYEDERARVLRVSLLLQEYANNDLQDDLEQLQDVDLKQSEDLVEDLQVRLDVLQQQYESTQAELKTCIRDIDEYQTELNALNTVKTDAAKNLSEKLALSRELGILRPELEHLRSQISTQDNILADKLSLERELATAQVELENEKKTVQRLKQQTTVDSSLQEELEEVKKEVAEKQKRMQKLERQNAKKANDKSAADAALVDELETVKQELAEAKVQIQQSEQALRQASAQQNTSDGDKALIDELRKDLAKERKAHQKLEREQLQKTTQWDKNQTEYERKLAAFREKVRKKQSQLDDVQEELERRDQAKYAQSAAATKARLAGRAPSVEPTQAQAQAQPENPKKRNIARFDPDMTIGTPGHGNPAAKRVRLTGSNIGDKSNFSITPYLNRTISVLPESPNEVINATINEIVAEADKEIQDTDVAKKSAAIKKPATEKPAANKPKAAKAPKEAKTAKAPALDKVVEEDDSEEGAVSQEDTTKPSDITTSEATTLQPKKKKLLNVRKNIFDDDEPDGIKRTGLTARGLGKVNLGLGRKAPKAMSAFSPLKKDRKMMTAAVGA